MRSLTFRPDAGADLKGRRFVNGRSFAVRLKEYAKHPFSFAVMIAVMLAAAAVSYTHLTLPTNSRV